MAQSLTGSQLARLAAALHFYGRRLSGPTWIAMEVAEPHDVVGFADSHAAAQALVSGRVPAYDVFGPYAPSHHPRYANVLDVYYHDCACGSTDCTAVTAAAKLPNLNELTSVQLTVQWTAGRATQSAVFNVFEGTNPSLPRPDAIFLSRGAGEAFMYPRYESLFGKHLTDLIRKKLGHDK